MLELAGDLGFLDEPLYQLGLVAMALEKNLHGEVAAQGGISAPEDCPHAAGDLPKKVENTLSSGRDGRPVGDWNNPRDRPRYGLGIVECHPIDNAQRVGLGPRNGRRRRFERAVRLVAGRVTGGGVTPNQGRVEQANRAEKVRGKAAGQHAPALATMSLLLDHAALPPAVKSFFFLLQGKSMATGGNGGPQLGDLFIDVDRVARGTSNFLAEELAIARPSRWAATRTALASRPRAAPTSAYDGANASPCKAGRRASKRAPLPVRADSAPSRSSTRPSRVNAHSRANSLSGVSS